MSSSSTPITGSVDTCISHGHGTLSVLPSCMRVRKSFLCSGDIRLTQPSAACSKAGR